MYSWFTDYEETIQILTKHNDELMKILDKIKNPNRETDFMNRSFERITSLEYCLKATNAEILAFQSGKKYQNMQTEHKR